MSDNNNAIDELNKRRARAHIQLKIAQLSAEIDFLRAERDIAVHALERINAEELHLGDVLDIASNTLMAIARLKAAPPPTGSETERK